MSDRKKDKARPVLVDDEGNVESSSLHQILNNTIDTIETNKEQIFEIYETARNEVEEARKRLGELRSTIHVVIDEVDGLAETEQKEKQELARISGAFGEYTEDDIRQCYERVAGVQAALSAAREKEKAMRQERDSLELRMRGLNCMLQQSEHLAMAVGSVLSYLSTQINGVFWKIEAVQQKQFVGARVIKAQEDERYRISRELHDGPAQDMANLIFSASIVEKLMDRDMDKAKEEIKNLRQEIKDCLKEVRQVIFDMRPMELDDIGLAAAIEQLAQKMKVRGLLDASFSVDGRAFNIPKHVSIAIFRIVQEALNNVAHHAGTDKARIRMLYGPSALSILIEDSGKGFDMDAPKEEEDDDPMVEPRGHFGLLGMGERARIIGAEFQVMSAPGKGTRVHLRVPNREPREFDEGEVRRLQKAAKKISVPEKGEPRKGTGGGSQMALGREDGFSEGK